jgi:hypothetical protein
MIVIAGLFFWTFTIALGIESGNEYEVAGSYRSIAGIVLALAGMGIEKMILIFGSLITIAIIAFLRKFNNPPTIHCLQVKR